MKNEFRVWDTEKQMMFDWLEVQGAMLGVGIGSPVRIFDNDQCIVMQSTGLLDKNGKEIYIGDIVRYEKLTKIKDADIDYFGKPCGMHFEVDVKFYEVVFEEYYITGKGFFNPKFDYPQMLFSEGTRNIEVVGNIYENRDLLLNKII